MAGAGLSSSSSASDSAATHVGVTTTGPQLSFNETGGGGGAPPWTLPGSPGAVADGGAPAVTYSLKAWIVTAVVTVTLAAFALYQYLKSRKGGDE